MLFVRNLQPNHDLLTVGKIYAESWKYAYRGILPQEYLDGIRPDLWTENLCRSGRHSLVAELEGRLIGTSSYGESRTPAYCGQGEIYSIYFLPEYMGKGYGRLLMEAALKELKTLGYNEAFLWVLNENSGARRFYEALGFTMGSAVKEAEIGGQPVHEVQYRIKIK